MKRNWNLPQWIRESKGNERWLVAGLLTLIVVILFAAVNTLRLEGLIALQQHSLQVQSRLDGFLQILSDYELVRRSTDKEARKKEELMVSEFRKADLVLKEIEDLLQHQEVQSTNLLKLRTALATIRSSPHADHLALLNNLEDVSQSMMDIESANLESQHPELAHQIHVVNLTTFVFGSLSLLLTGFAAFAVSREIRHRRLIQQRLERSERAARSAAELKSRFVATVSHELRTPLNGIISVGELLRRQAMPTESARLIEIIHQSGRTLLRVINDILDFSKIEAGKIQIEEADFSLIAVVDRVVGALSPKAQSKNIELTIKIDEGLKTNWRGDADRLSQVLFNLLGNGIKFTDHGSVHLEIHPDRKDNEGRQWMRFSVADTGIGMGSEELKLIFQPFVQHEKASTNDDPGTGLGLTISRSLIIHMGGDIWVESIPKKGSRFQFVIPLKPAESLAMIDTKVASVSKLRFESGRPPLVLVAEDNSTNQEIAQSMLAALGVEVQVAANGLEVLDLLEKTNFNLILMDCQMPELDGYEATKRIRKNQALRHLPIVAMTANATPRDRAHCSAVGMSDFLAKPILMADLSAVLERWLATIPLANIDRSVSAGLSESIGQAAYEKVVIRFLSSLPQLMDGLAHFQSDTSSAEDLRKLAHRYRSSSMALGAARMAQLCSEIEKSQEPRDQLLILVKDLENEVRAVQRTLS